MSQGSATLLSTRRSSTTELHVIPGLPHGFDMLAPDAVVTQRILETRLRRLKLL